MSVSCHSGVSGITRLSHVLLMNNWIAFSCAAHIVCIEKWSIFLTDERAAILISALLQRLDTLENNANILQRQMKMFQVTNQTKHLDF